MRTLTLRKAAIVAALPLALSSLAACGSSSSQATATDPQAVRLPPRAESRRPVGQGAVPGPVKAAGEKITTARVSMTMDMSRPDRAGQGVIDMTGDSPAMQMTIQVAGMGAPTEMRLVDKAIYVQMPGGGGKFYKIDLTDPNGPMGSLGGDALDNLDPGSVTSTMSSKTLKKVTDRGVSTVDGQQLHHYAVLMDLSAIAHLPNLPVDGRDAQDGDVRRVARRPGTLRAVPDAHEEHHEAVGDVLRLRDGRPRRGAARVGGGRDAGDQQPTS